MHGHRHGLGTFHLSDGLSELDGEWLHDEHVGKRPPPPGSEPEPGEGDDDEVDDNEDWELAGAEAAGKYGSASTNPGATPPSSSIIKKKKTKKGYVPPTVEELQAQMEVAESIEEQIDILRQIMRMNTGMKMIIPPLLSDEERRKRRLAKKEKK